MPISYNYSVLKQEKGFKMFSSYCNWKVLLSVSVLVFIIGILLFAFKDFNGEAVSEENTRNKTLNDTNSEDYYKGEDNAFQTNTSVNVPSLNNDTRTTRQESILNDKNNQTSENIAESGKNDIFDSSDEVNNGGSAKMNNTNLVDYERTTESNMVVGNNISTVARNDVLNATKYFINSTELNIKKVNFTNVLNNTNYTFISNNNYTTNESNPLFKNSSNVMDINDNKKENETSSEEIENKFKHEPNETSFRGMHFNNATGNNTVDISKNTTYNMLPNAANTNDLNYQNSKVYNNNLTNASKDAYPNIDNDTFVLTNLTMNILKGSLKCTKNSYLPQKVRRGDYVVLENVVKAGHGEIECYQYVTLATHGEFTDLAKIETMVSRWSGPISVALFSPGSDFISTLRSIQYLRSCSPQRKLIKQWVTFHTYTLFDHLLENQTYPKVDVDCNSTAPFNISGFNGTYRTQKNLTYPANVGRNIARDLALTHYILSLDSDVVPSPNIGPKFLNMLARSTSLMHEENRIVFAIQQFEVGKDQKLPDNKTELLKLIDRNDSSIIFGYENAPYVQKWIKQSNSSEINVIGISKRLGQYSKWTTPYIGTKKEPSFEDKVELNSWTGLKTQPYILCVQDYDFMVLSNAYVLHYSDKKYVNETNFETTENITNKLRNNDKNETSVNRDYEEITDNKRPQNISLEKVKEERSTEADNLLDIWKINDEVLNKPEMNENETKIESDSNESWNEKEDLDFKTNDKKTSNMDKNQTMIEVNNFTNWNRKGRWHNPHIFDDIFDTKNDEKVSLNETKPNKEEIEADDDFLERIREKRDLWDLLNKTRSTLPLTNMRLYNQTTLAQDTIKTGRKDVEEGNDEYFNNLLRQKYDRLYGTRDGCYLL